MFLTLDVNWTSGSIVSTQRNKLAINLPSPLPVAPHIGILMSSGRTGTGSLWFGGMRPLAPPEIRDNWAGASSV